MGLQLFFQVEITNMLNCVNQTKGQMHLEFTLVYGLIMGSHKITQFTIARIWEEAPPSSL
jgi:hypothetical protein